MNRILASAAALVMAGCASRGYSGYASEDLQEVTIFLSTSRNSVVSGVPRLGSPVDFARNLSTPGISLLELTIKPDDSTGIQKVMEESEFPILIDFGETMASLHLEGLSWELRITPGPITRGAALLLNDTGETWHADQVQLDAGREPLARSSGTVVIPPQGVLFPWWEIETSPPDTLLVYGFPVEGRWNPVIAIPVRETPPPLPEGCGALHRSDTLWIPADNLLQTDLSWTFEDDGYDCRLDMRSTSEKDVHYRIILPGRLPRGAVTEPGDGFTPEILIPSGETRRLEYREIYRG